MDDKLLWLFLFFALAIGWFLGRLDARKNKSFKARSQDSSFIKNRLQLLFDSYSDSSIEQMLHSLQVTPETFMTHVSIGRHFRKQGEVEKAILVHQNLMAHPELSTKNSDTVILELAKDYKAAGLFDRAIALLEQLTSSKEYHYDANLLLLDIKEREKEWDNAVVCARKIDVKKYPEIKNRLAQYLCEIADEKAQESKVRESEGLYNEAVQIDKGCVRALLGLAQIEYSRREYGQSIKFLKRIPEISPQDTVLIFPLLLKCTEETQSFNQYFAYLDALFDKTNLVSILTAKSEAIRLVQGDDESSLFILDAIEKHPHMALFRYFVKKQKSQSQKDLIEVAKHMTKVILDDEAGKDKFKCNKCGFTCSHLMWQCPSCKDWQSIKPVPEYVNR